MSGIKSSKQILNLLNRILTQKCKKYDYNFELVHAQIIYLFLVSVLLFMDPISIQPKPS